MSVKTVKKVSKRSKKVDLTPVETLTDIEQIKLDIGSLKDSISGIMTTLKEFSKKEEQVNGQTEVIQRLVHERLGTFPESGVIGDDFRDSDDSDADTIQTTTSKSTKQPSKNQAKKSKPTKKPSMVRMKKHDESQTLVYGKTFDNRHHIKEVGASWYPDEKGWLVATDSVFDLMEIFRSNNVEFEQDND
jgi:hypothetical protein